MNKKLEDIAAISTGVFKKGSPSGTAYYLQAKHFDEYGRFHPEGIITPEISMDGRLRKHLLQDGDILLVSKGFSNKACLYPAEVGPALASSTFLVISVKDEGVYPEYIQWYLNTSAMQAILSSLARGTRIPSLSKKALAKVEVQIPSIQRQKQILEMQRLWEKERALTFELIELKEALYQGFLFDLTKSNTNA
ncbi:MAG: restriction endonuclease subunit S [Lewinellaceae bacterium]|nr:restriction endonuclease subunit S [Lewinellaceae bacterium]MCB9287713.1 restriction endonuclease subunit S [Lewinellaceae bacterium]